MDDQECGRVPNEAVADLHKALLKQGGQTAAAYGTLSRSKSEGHSPPRADEAARLKTPGGFRRHFLNERADAAGVPLADRPAAWRRSLQETIRGAATAHSESALGIRLHPMTGAEVSMPGGTADVPQTVLALLKSFIGSGITFMPCAFSQGGWLFCTVFLIGIAAVNALCIWMLIECRKKTGCSSFGDIAFMVSGQKGKIVVQASLVVSQFAVCTAYIIFVSSLAQSIGFHSKGTVIFLQLIPLVPLCLLRSVEQLEYPNLLADLLIMFGIGIVLFHSTSIVLGSQRVQPVTVPFKSSTCGIFIGIAIFTFEGIPMILPIQNAMREPERFWPVFIKLFISIVSLFTIFGLLGYFAFGNSVETVVLLNLPPSHALSTVVKVSYMLALILGLPLMFLPAARITELWAFGVVKPAAYTWRKNMLRTVEVLAFAIIALKGSNVFAQFLSFTGAFCCAPIAFIYPTVFHFRLCAESRLAQAMDIGVILIGLVAVGIALWGCV